MKKILADLVLLGRVIVAISWMNYFDVFHSISFCPGELCRRPVAIDTTCKLSEVFRHEEKLEIYALNSDAIISRKFHLFVFEDWINCLLESGVTCI